MYSQLIDHSPDLKRLRDQGYEVHLKEGHVLVSGVPYLDSKKDVQRGTLVSTLTINGEKAGAPNTHVIHFIGEHPCEKDGSEIFQIKHSVGDKTLGEDIVINHTFSHKPGRNYYDYYEKFTTYINVISGPVRSDHYSISAQTYKLVETEDLDSVFNYPDTNSSRAEILAISNKLKGQKIAVIGIGGTGSYVLDHVAKTPVAEIHIFDGDLYLLHNAFRGPGAPDKEVLRNPIMKVDYFHSIYSKMHRHIIPHPYYITKENLDEIEGFDYVFVCIDKGQIKRYLIDHFKNNKISFSDVGMGVLVTEGGSIIGQVRVTSAFGGEVEEILQKGRISLADDDPDDDYNQNIQISDLNSINAGLAVLRWKKHSGFYAQAENERNTVFIIDDNSIINEDS